MVLPALVVGIMVLSVMGMNHKDTIWYYPALYITPSTF